MTDDQKLVLVGKLGRPRGVHGAMFVTPLTDFPERFEGMTEILVKDRQGWQPMKIEKAELISGRPVLRFEGVTTPEQASTLTNRELAVPRENLVELPSGSFFIFDLIDCEVYDADSGELLGKLVEVDHYPANDVYVIRTPEGKSLSLAAVNEFVKEVDVAAGKILVYSAGLVDSN